VAGLRELAAGRAGLLAEVAGSLEGFAEGELDEPDAGEPRSCAVTPERIRIQTCLDRDRAAAGSPGPAAGVPGRPAPRVWGGLRL
jgi:hypothetical protein